jgi:hypothetical protein
LGPFPALSHQREAARLSVGFLGENVRARAEMQSGTRPASHSLCPRPPALGYGEKAQLFGAWPTLGTLGWVSVTAKDSKRLRQVVELGGPMRYTTSMQICCVPSWTHTYVLLGMKATW